MSRSSPRHTWRLVLAIVAVVLVDLPPAVALLTSFKTDAAIDAVPPRILFAPTLVHYLSLFTASGYDFYQYVWHSLIIAGGSSLLVVAVSLPASYAVARNRRALGWLYSYGVALRLIPYIALTVPTFLLFETFGLIDSLLGMVLIETLFSVPLAIMMLVNAIAQMPIGLEEAALIDGARLVGMMRHVILPLSRPIAVAVLILSFIGAWNEFLYGLLLTVQRAVPVTVGASLFVTAYGVQWGNMAAAIVVAVIPTLVLTFAGQRLIIGGITAGAVKG